MEAVTAHAVVGVIVVRQGIHKGLGGHGLVERGVKHADLRHVLAHDLDAGVDAGDVGRVVQGGEGSAVLQRLHDLVGDEHAAGKLLAAVDDAMSDRVDLVHGAHNAVFQAGELVDDRSDGLCVAGEGNILVEDGLVSDQRGVLEMTVDADALAQTLGEKLLILHVDELILQRRASRVDDQNFHF